MAQGLARVVPGDALTVIGNTADDFWHHGLRICPDLDTVMYTLAGIANPATGWGIANDTHHTLDALTRYGEAPWFQVGDQDFATHILRSARLRADHSLTHVTAALAAALGVTARLLPMTDDEVATRVLTPTSELDFQEYFVARRQMDDVIGISFAGIDQACPTPEVLAAIAEAVAIVICPSNPIVSIGPILAVPGLRDALAAATAPVVAISPIVGGRALKGPADRMLATLGHEVSALGVARILSGLVEVFVLDEADADLAAAVAALGMRPVVTRTVMGDATDRARLASESLNALGALGAPV
ncbi:MAG: 2-phospho-L-lactate transferase [Chloroflexia bacterium]|nr:2-phospho-L-lactate transferase [Chloroflexia bacterium]